MKKLMYYVDYIQSNEIKWDFLGENLNNKTLKKAIQFFVTMEDVTEVNIRIQIVDLPETQLYTFKKRAHKSLPEKPTIVSQFFDYYQSLNVGEVYTKKTIMAALGLNSNQWCNLRDNKDINYILKCDHEAASENKNCYSYIKTIV